MASPKGMRTVPITVNETDAVHIYSDCSKIWLQLRRDYPTISDIGITSFKTAVSLTPNLALKIAAELVSIASRSNTTTTSSPAPADEATAESPMPAPENSGKLWTEKEEKQLRSRYGCGLSIPEIAKKHKRGLGSVSARLKKLGLDPYRSTPSSRIS